MSRVIETSKYRKGLECCSEWGREEVTCQEDVLGREHLQRPEKSPLHAPHPAPQHEAWTDPRSSGARGTGQTQLVSAGWTFRGILGEHERPGYRRAASRCWRAGSGFTFLILETAANNAARYQGSLTPYGASLVLKVLLLFHCYMYYRLSEL